MNDSLDIEVLRKECNAGHLKWTAHTLEKMQERKIEPTDVISCILNGTIIEQYPQAYPYPACLILGKTASDVIIHSVIGYGNSHLWIVTVYEPDENEWINGFTERKG